MKIWGCGEGWLCLLMLVCRCRKWLVSRALWGDAFEGPDAPDHLTRVSQSGHTSPIQFR